MIAITTKSSINVKAGRRCGIYSCSSPVWELIIRKFGGEIRRGNVEGTSLSRSGNERFPNRLRACPWRGRARPTGPFTRGSGGRGTHLVEAPLRGDRQTPVKMRARTRKSAERSSSGRRAATEGALDFGNGPQVRAAGTPPGKRSRTARQGARRPARSSSRPGYGTQSTNLRNWSVRNAGGGRPTHRRHPVSRNNPHDCRTRQQSHDHSSWQQCPAAE